MVNHTGNLQHKWFDYIVSGQKTYEARVNRDKWTTINVNDTIEFTCIGEESKCTVKVIGIIHFDSFSSACSRLGNDLLPSGEDESVYRNIYFGSEIGIGVIVYQIKLIKLN